MQATGLWPDWLLIFVWARLALASRPATPRFVWWGLTGALLHMAEILPLLLLLVGVITPPPWLPGARPAGRRQASPPLHALAEPWVSPQDVPARAAAAEHWEVPRRVQDRLGSSIQRGSQDARRKAPTQPR